jgi:hypothetical protein
MLTNRRPLSDGIAPENCSEEWARQILLADLDRAIWQFGVDPNSPFATRLRRLLDGNAADRGVSP